jgi:hypothetical protein
LSVTPVTFGTLQSRVAAVLIDPNSTAVSLSNVGQAINDAIQFWKQRKFQFNQRLVKLTLDVQDPYVLGYGNSNPAYPSAPVLPSDFLYEDAENGFVIPYNNISYQIKKVPPHQYDRNNNYTAYGIPFIYTYRNGNYELYFYPNLAYTLNVYYIADYQYLVNSTDTNDWTNYADKLIEYDAIARLLADLRLDEARADKFRMRRDEELVALESRALKQNATGNVTVYLP